MLNLLAVIPLVTSIAVAISDASAEKKAVEKYKKELLEGKHKGELKAFQKKLAAKKKLEEKKKLQAKKK